MANVTLESLKNSRETIIGIVNIFIDVGRKLSIKYKELGKFWDDKAYRSVGDSIVNCLENLLENTQKIQNTIKTLDQLIINVEEYENNKISNINNNSSNNFLSSLKGMTEDNSNPDIYRCGDIEVINGAEKISIDYRDMIDNRIANASSKAKQVYKTYSKRVVIHSVNYNGIPGYYENDGYDRGIYYNYIRDTNGNDFFSYVGEMIDASRKPNYSNNWEFENSLLNEISQYNGNSSEIKSLLRMGYDNLNSRAFSTFFQASMGNLSLLNEIRTNLPESYRNFDNILENMIGHERGAR